MSVITLPSGVKIRLERGSVVETKVDAIVNSTNLDLNLKSSGALSREILNKAGPRLQEECNRKYPEGFEPGSVAATGGHDLHQKMICHVHLPLFDSEKDLQHLEDDIILSLVEVTMAGHNSIAFPPLGCGAAGYPESLAAETMVAILVDILSMNETLLSDVRIVFQPSDEQAMKEFLRVFKQHMIEPDMTFLPPPSPPPTLNFRRLQTQQFGTFPRVRNDNRADVRKPSDTKDNQVETSSTAGNQVKVDSGYSSLKVERHKSFIPTPQREKSTPQKVSGDKILRHSSLKHPPQREKLTLLPRKDASGKVLRHASVRQPPKSADTNPRKDDDRRKGYYNTNNNTGFAIDQHQEGGLFKGMIRVHMNLIRPINMAMSERPTSIYDVLTEGSDGEEHSGKTEVTSFYLPKDTVKVIHIKSDTTAHEVIRTLLSKFRITDNPSKFALYEKVFDEDKSGKGTMRRLANDEKPLPLCLKWTNTAFEGVEMTRFILQENDAGEILWDKFSLPELQNCLKILNKEEDKYVDQVKHKYKLMKVQLRSLMEVEGVKPKSRMKEEEIFV